MRARFGGVCSHCKQAIVAGQDEVSPVEVPDGRKIWVHTLCKDGAKAAAGAPAGAGAPPAHAAHLPTQPQPLAQYQPQTQPQYSHQQPQYQQQPPISPGAWAHTQGSQAAGPGGYNMASPGPASQPQGSQVLGKRSAEAAGLDIESLIQAKVERAIESKLDSLLPSIQSVVTSALASSGLAGSMSQGSQQQPLSQPQSQPVLQLYMTQPQPTVHLHSTPPSTPVGAPMHAHAQAAQAFASPQPSQLHTPGSQQQQQQDPERAGSQQLGMQGSQEAPGGSQPASQPTPTFHNGKQPAQQAPAFHVTVSHFVPALKATVSWEGMPMSMWEELKDKLRGEGWKFDSAARTWSKVLAPSPVGSGDSWREVVQVHARAEEGLPDELAEIYATGAEKRASVILTEDLSGPACVAWSNGQACGAPTIGRITAKEENGNKGRAFFHCANPGCRYHSKNFFWADEAPPPLP